MKPAKFDYVAPVALEAAVRELQSGAKPLAGGQSLGPMLNLRLARPDRLVDISLLERLRACEQTETGARLGAAIRHAEIEDGVVADPTPGWLRSAAGAIAHRAVRNRGTIGGSLAHADPAADWVIVLTGLDADVLLLGPGGERRMPVAEFVTGAMATALAPDELTLAVEIRRPAEGARWGYWKFVRQVGEFAKASATVLIDPNRDGPRAALGALGDAPRVLADDHAAALVEGAMTAAEAAALTLADRPPEQRALHAAALQRALEQALAGADAPLNSERQL